MGASRDDIKEWLRVFPVGNYLIFYFPLSDGVDILRVLHGSMEAERHFS
jgi:toxin ParE1/3/4